MTHTDKVISALYLAKSSNREKMLSDLILNILFNINEPIQIESIIDFIIDTFHLRPIKYEVQQCLDSLIETDRVSCKEGFYCLTESAKGDLHKLVITADGESLKRKKTFHTIVKDIFDGNVTDEEIDLLWKIFNEYLIECFIVFGKRALKIFLPYEIDELAEDDKIIKTAYKKLNSDKLISIFKQLIIEYPERLNELELRYLTLLATRAEKFYSLGIEKEDYEKIKNLQLKDLIVLVDTNILYSILKLRVHSENPAIDELVRIAKEKQIDLRIVYLPKTYSELQKAKAYIEKLIPKENYKLSHIKALVNSEKLDQMSKQYYESKLKDSEFPHPSEKIRYASDLLKQNSINIYNNSFQHLFEDDKYINAKIVEYTDFEKYYNELCEEKDYDAFLNKDGKKVEHDILLRECVKSLKSKFTDDNALRFICLTLDRSLIHFDNHILRKESFQNKKLINPNFIIPSLFLRKIRPFIPITTNDYRKAFISSLTAPNFEKQSDEETILIQKSIGYFKNLGIDNEEIILNCIKRELFLEDFAKHEESHTSEDFIKSTIAIELDQIKYQNIKLEVEKSEIIKEKNLLKETTESKVTTLVNEVTQKDDTINDLESRLKFLESEREKELKKADLERRKNKWDLEKSDYVNKKWDEKVISLKSDVKYCLKIGVLTLIPIILGIVIKSFPVVDEFLKSFGQLYYNCIWGLLILIIAIEMFGRSYVFNKERVKNGWFWFYSYFNNKHREKMVIQIKTKILNDYINDKGQKPAV